MMPMARGRRARGCRSSTRAQARSGDGALLLPRAVLLGGAGEVLADGSDRVSDQMNLYGYVNNDPGNATDPSGACPWCPPLFYAVLATVRQGARACLRDPRCMGEVMRLLATVVFTQSGEGTYYLTYTKYNEITGETYSGSTSRRGESADDVLRQRDREHARDGKSPQDGWRPAVLDKSIRVQGDANVASHAIAYSIMKGREQQLIDYHGGAKSEGGTSANAIRGSRPRPYSSGLL
jgi:hypothetical protein